MTNCDCNEVNLRLSLPANYPQTVGRSPELQFHNKSHIFHVYYFRVVGNVFQSLFGVSPITTSEEIDADHIRVTERLWPRRRT